MSSETQGQLVIFTCNMCGESTEVAGTWKEVWEMLKDEGWRCFKDEEADEWVHHCADCRRNPRGAR
jgi:hypothetical protein